MASGLSDFYRFEREELLRAHATLHTRVASAGAPMPSVKALGQLHADVLRRQSELHDEWEERVALGLERGARGGAASRDEARATTAQLRHRVRYGGHPTLLGPKVGNAASRGSTAAGPRASTSSGSPAVQAGAPSQQPSASWGFGIGPDGSAGTEWARGGGGRVGTLRTAPEVSPLKAPARPLSRALTAASGARASSGAPAPGPLSPSHSQPRHGHTTGAGAGAPSASASWGDAALGPPAGNGGGVPEDGLVGGPLVACERPSAAARAGTPAAEPQPMRSGTPPDFPNPEPEPEPEPDPEPDPDPNQVEGGLVPQGKPLLPFRACAVLVSITIDAWQPLRRHARARAVACGAIDLYLIRSDTRCFPYRLHAFSYILAAYSERCLFGR